MRFLDRRFPENIASAAKQFGKAVVDVPQNELENLRSWDATAAADNRKRGLQKMLDTKSEGK